MGDRVPISTIPGLITPWVDEVQALVPATGYGYTVTNVYLVRNGYDVTGTVVVELSNGTDTEELTIPDNTATVTNDISLAVGYDEALTLTVTATDAVSENLRGWVEVVGESTVTTALTTLTRVKYFLGLLTNDENVILNQLIASVSEEIQRWLGRRIILETETNEPVDSIGRNLIALRHRPIYLISSVTENGTALVEDTDFESVGDDKEAGLLARISGGYPSTWASGRRVVKVTYVHGYLTVPDELQQAATELVAFDFLNSQPGGKRFGMTQKVLDSGGTSSYRSRDEVWADNMKRLAPHRRA